MNLTAIRAIGLGIVSVLTATGLVPAEVGQIIVENANAILGGVTGVWSVIAGWRAVKERKAAKGA